MQSRVRSAIFARLEGGNAGVFVRHEAAKEPGEAEHVPLGDEAEVLGPYVLGDDRRGEAGLDEASVYKNAPRAPVAVLEGMNPLEAAVEVRRRGPQDILRKNPCNFTKPHKRVKSKINTLDRTERSRMLDLAFRAMPNPLAMAIGLALTTGMRRDEVCALRWSDMNEDGAISVARALGNAGGTFYEKGPKTDSSCRTIPLAPSIASALHAIRADKEYVCRSLGAPFGDPYLLGAAGLDSRPYSPGMLSKDFKAFCKMNGFTCTFHDLRHTFVTFMIGAAVDVWTVASYLGHASCR